MKAALPLLALAACASILGFKPSQPTAFPHRAHVTKGIACTTCHQGLERKPETGELHLPTDATCTQAACHAKPHDDHPCLGCHADPDAVALAADARDHLKFEHDKHLPRARGNCMRCHVGVAEGDDRIRPSMQICFSCHGQQQDARTCDACHKDLAEEGTLPQSHLTHDGDWLHEHGARAGTASDVCATCHQQPFCASCHGVDTPALPAKLHFDDPMRASVHRAGFASRHALEARVEPGSCTSCHAPSSCLTCHAEKGVSAEKSSLSPHPAGWIGLTRETDQHGRAARADPAECAGCHSGGGEALCVRCHQVGGPGGNPHPVGWSSRQPIGALPCRMCHPIGSTP
ncbi:MAG TPA: hypothetical protein VL463_34205 [Kofleriaceae bacterium]|jgi:hypothetical protein|nr:hypothetical protein [Kofleriaceae bacterium]